MARKTAREIDVEAADWLARMDRDALTDAEETQLQAWLAADVRQLGALGRMQALSAVTERARALGSGFDPAPVEETPHSRRAVLGGAAAAVAAGAVIGWDQLHQGLFRTAKGETKVIALKDGSVVTLNTQSEIAVQFTAAERSVRLIQGEVLFDVARNKAHPFVVAAGDTRVKVVGTSFTVRKLDTTPVQVLVREGVVEVSKPQTSAPPVRIAANTRATAPDDQEAIAAVPIAPAELTRRLAWREGQLAFEGQTLAQAASEFARYSDVRILITDDALAHEEIAGLFKANDPVGFAKTVAISLNAQAKISEGQVELSRPENSSIKN